MTDNDHISYYCFNKACMGSVYNCDSTEVTDLPFTALTLGQDHHCALCGSKLISVIDIELRQAMSKKVKAPKLLRYAYRY